MIKSLLAAAVMIHSVAQADMHQRGTAALEYIESNMRLEGNLYAEHVTPGKGPSGPSSAWSAGVQLSALNAAAAIDRSKLESATRYAQALDAYRWKKPNDVLGYQPFPVGDKAGDLYYDDNAWLVLAFLETYHLTQDKQYLQRAQDAFDYLASGESDDLGGGIWWADFKKQKNTCSNAPAICAALALYDVTKKPELLAFAKRIYVWTNQLQDKDGLFFDNISRDGKTIEKTKWSYNSALMIRANVMLYRATKEAAYLAEARRIAAASESKWFRKDGSLADEGSFAHLLCEALLDLHHTSPVPSAVEKVMRSLDRLHSLQREGGYPKRWDGWRAEEDRIELLQQASAARAFLIAAQATSATPRQ